MSILYDIVFSFRIPNQYGVHN